jgi:hypothetical protein
MTQTITEVNKRLVLKAFNMLFTKRDQNTALRFLVTELHPAQPSRKAGKACST